MSSGEQGTSSSALRGDIQDGLGKVQDLASDDLLAGLGTDGLQEIVTVLRVSLQANQHCSLFPLSVLFRAGTSQCSAATGWGNGGRTAPV